MNTSLLAWRRLVPVWLPATLACLAAIGVFIWQGSLGREIRLRERVSELEGSLHRLERARADAARDRADVAAVEAALERAYREVFGTLDERMVPILREIGGAAKAAGLPPKSFAYEFIEDRQAGTTEFVVDFAVEGDYQQVRTLLGTLQASTQFLIVKSLTFRGEVDATSNSIGIALEVATVVAETDAATIATVEAMATMPTSTSSVAEDE